MKMFAFHNKKSSSNLYFLCCAVCLLLYFLSVQHARAYLQRYVSALYGTRATAAIPCPAYCDLWHFRFGECEMNGSTRNKQNFCSFQVFLLCFFFCISERMVFVWSFRWNRFVRWKYDTGEANLNEIDVVIIGFRRGIIANVDCGAGQNWCDWFIAIHNCDFSAKCYRRKLWMKWRNSFNKFSLFDDIFNSIRFGHWRIRNNIYGCATHTCRWLVNIFDANLRENNRMSCTRLFNAIRPWLSKEMFAAVHCI